MQDEFLVHTREGEPCPRCDGDIERIVVAGRSTYFCPGLPGEASQAAAPGASGPRTAPMSEPIHLPTASRSGTGRTRWALTGCSVVLPPEGGRGGIWVMGGGPGTRETDGMDPLSRSEGPTAVLITGGSAFGIAAADGVSRWLEERERGYGPRPGPCRSSRPLSSTTSRRGPQGATGPR